MPEMPEVEITRQGLAAPLLGARVLGLRLGKPLRWPLGVAADRLSGTRIGAITRRGKYLWLPLEPQAGGLLLHLGMSGALTLWPLGQALPAAGPHDHFELATTAGTLRLTDPRRFGAVVWSAGLDVPPARVLLQGLGAEPFDESFTAAHFHAALQQRRSPIKQVLLSGQLIVGAGNIYACEALYAAGIDPRTRAQRLSRPRAARLLTAVRATLARALELGGSTLRDFHSVHGMEGRFQAQAGVYGREGLPCGQCGQPVRRVVQAQRSSFFCATCQKR
jgi:formamidopyrimidine-DNA glycosylase